MNTVLGKYLTATVSNPSYFTIGNHRSWQNTHGVPNWYCTYINIIDVTYASSPFY